MRKGIWLAVAAVLALVVGVGTAAAADVRVTRCINGPDSVTVPAGEQIFIKLGWATSQPGNMNKFLKSQQVSWTITTSSGGSYADNTSTYGDTTYWSTPTQTIINGNKTLLSIFLAPTGVVLAQGETATFNFELSSDAKVYDDGGAVYPAGVLFTMPTCTITGI